MFWNFLLAHFLADYPFQSAWMVAHKDRWPALVLHAGVHFVLLMLVVMPAWRALWPYCLLLALVHLLIDRGKIALSGRRPDWVVLPYLVDQLLHYLTLGAVAAWIYQTQGNLNLLLAPGLAVFITGYLLVTYVWAISEKVVLAARPAGRQELTSSSWSRMAARALLLTGLLWLLYPGWTAVAGFLQGAVFPYRSGNHARRALLTDLLVTLATWLFIILAYQQASGG